MVGALTFGCFSTLWTSLAFLLSGAPYHYGNGVIGLFGLVGVVGALAASGAGRLADRGHNGRATTVSILIMLASWGVLALGKTSVVALIAGIALLDLGVQGVAHLQPERDLRAAPRGPQPADDRLHGGLLPRRRRAVGDHLVAVRLRRLGRRLRARRGHGAARAGRSGPSPRRRRAGAPDPARAVV